MDDLAAGGAVGELFAELYNGAFKLIRNYSRFEPLLGDLRTTLVTLNPLIQNIIAQNRLMRLPNKVTENLKTDIVEGIKLVEKYSKPGSMVDFLKRPTTYTTELRALDESLKKQLNMLQCYSLWVVNDTHNMVTLVAKAMNVIPKDRLPNFTNNLVCYTMEGEASTSMMSGESRFKVLYDCLNEMTNKSTIRKSHFKGIVSTLDSLVPTIKMFEDYSDKLGMNQDILERFRMHTEQGIEAVQKYSKTSRLKLFRLNEYADLCRWEQSFQNQLEIMKEHIARDAKNYNVSVSVTNVTTVNQIQVNFIQAAQHGYNIGAWCEVPELPEFTVGLEMAVMDLKRMFFTDDKSVIGICGMGGVGKTTLAASFCRDQQVQDEFRKNIYFVTCGSPKANLSRIVQELYQSRGWEAPVFQNDVAAEKWFRKCMKHQAQSPLLLVVDDVWDDSLLDMIDFEIPNYKILFTSRRHFPKYALYHLELLSEKQSWELLHHTASLGDKSSHIPQDLARKINHHCEGLPLLITTVGRSLCGMPIETWRSKLIDWSGGSILQSENPVSFQLQSNLDSLDEEKAVVRECFIDLGSFPHDKRIYVASLIDMWAELYGLVEDVRCIAILYELSARSLATYVAARKDTSESDRYYTSDFVTQHDLLKELAIYTMEQVEIEDKERIFVNISDNHYLPEWWRIPIKGLQIKARLLSITTDQKFEGDLPDIELPVAMVLVLNFETMKYALPIFVKKMARLKVLIATNYGIGFTELSNSELLNSLTNLKRIRFERILIPSVLKESLRVESLVKISFFMCGIGQTLSKDSLKLSDAFPFLEELNIDYCSDLVELHADLCYLIRLRNLGITNCQKLLVLPEQIGRLINLEKLRLRSCESLVTLPESTKDLKKANFLDISYCKGIKELPKDIGKMSNLKRFSMVECSALGELPSSVVHLDQLEEVICDDETKKLWEAFLPVLTKIRIVVVRVQENLSPDELGTSGVTEHSTETNSEPIVELDVPLKESQNQMVDAPSSGLVPNIDVSVAHSSEKDPIVDGKAGMKHILSVDAERHETEEPGQISSLGMQDLNQARQRFQMLSTRLMEEYEEHIKMLESKLSNYQTAEESWKLEKQKLENQLNFAMAQVKAGETNAADVTKDVLGRLFRYVMENMNGSDTIAVDMEEKVLGFAGSIYINRDDVIEFKEMKPISAPCINVYMRHLFDVLMKQPNKDGVFCFWDASSIWEKQTPEEKSELLATRLHELPTKKICLVPYNTGNHWILTIINIEEDICYFMDPLHSAKYPEVWKSVVNNAIKKYKGSPSRHQSKETEWITLKGPKQPSHVECGYYVMRYMKEIVEDLTLSFAEKWGCGTIFSAYTKEEVDEVRFEWALLVYAYGRRRPLVSG